MRKLDWYNLLKKQEEKDGANILKINNYSFDDIEVCKRQDDCYFICICGNEFNKKVRQIIEKTGLYCYECSLDTKQDKIKQINLDKYGVECVLQNIEVREKGKKTMIEKYGNDHPSKVAEIQNKKIEKINKRNKEHPEILAEIQEKIYNKWEQKYGVRHIFQNEEIKKKCTETIRERYGVDNVSQNLEIHNKKIKNSFRKKEYILPSGEIILVQGDETYTLDDLFNSGYKEDDILTEYIVDYEYNNQKHRYFADTYIISENKIIETKSDYTMELDYDLNMVKWEACVEQGFDFEFWIYDEKKNKTILKL